MKNELKDGLIQVASSIKAVMALLTDNPADLNLQSMERKYILAALKLYDTKKDAANALGITVQTLISKQKKYKIRKDEL